MALSAKERKQRQLERERQELLQETDATYPYLQTPFHRHLEDDANWSSVELCFELMGLEPPMFEDDRGPDEFANEACFATDEDRAEAFQSSQGSIGRAEVMIDVLLDAASELASIVNNYKSQQVAQYRAALEQRDLSEPKSRKEALAEAAHIAKLQEGLARNVRRTLPQWRIKGV